MGENKNLIPYMDQQNKKSAEESDGRFYFYASSYNAVGKIHLFLETSKKCLELPTSPVNSALVPIWVMAASGLQRALGHC